MRKILLPAWILGAIALFLYSYTQVDLSLTLTRASFVQGIQKAFQYVGYFNRPLSTYIYVGIVIFLFFLYCMTINFVNKKLIDAKTLWKIIIFTSVILTVSYAAFSYDLFNYIFDAKILTHYHSNPYLHKALDYPQDPMLSFMHWTHRTYPYGPFWLLITVPISFIGFGYFIVTFYLFKLLMLGGFIGSAIFIEKIAKKVGINSLLPLAAFALNPIVLIESLVSSHNDIVMIFFGLLALYYFLEKRYIRSFIGLVISIGIKYATVMMIPAIIARGVLRVSRDTFFYLLIVSMLVTVGLASYRTQFQPWYILYALPFAAFVQNKYFVTIPVVIVSFLSLLQYVPYLYLGNWDPPVPAILSALSYGSIVLSALLVILYKFVKPNKAE